MEKHVPHDSDTVMGIDANCRLGTAEDHVMGGWAPQIPSAHASHMHALLDKWSMCLPSTFRNKAAPGPSGTWHSPTGEVARIDYLAVSSALYVVDG
eukprot:1615912-Alexandrium_andersonii.AAC.1